MTFTKHDAATFLIGLGAALAITLGEALITADTIAADPAKWAIGVGTGLATAAGRYIVTQLAARGLTPK